MSNRSDIFGLEELYLFQRQGNWPTEAFLKPPYSLPWNYGYIAGGTPAPGLSSTVQRIDMSNDNNVTSTRGPLTRVAYAGGGVISSDTHGYFVMGNFPYGGSYTSYIDRIEYANDTVTAIPRGNLSVPKLGSLTSNNSYGYNAGGWDDTAAYSSVDRIDFSNDTANASPKGPLSGVRYRHTGVGNQDYGYASAGNSYPPVARTQIDRIDYSNDTATAPSRVAMGPYSDGQATGNADNGYFYKTTETLKYDYSNDTTALTSVGALATPTYRAVGVSNSQYGYIAGGDNTSPAFISTIQRQEFSNDTATLSIRGLLTRSGTVFKSTSNQSNGRLRKGLFNLSVPNNQIGITTTGASVQFDVGKNVFSYPYGYFGGGFDPAIPGRTSRIDRLDYSNDTSDAPTRASLPQGIQYSTALGNRNFGYWAGGNTQPGPIHSSIYRYDYSNDTANTTTVSTLSRNGRGFGNTSNDNFGYFAGGDPAGPTRVSTVDRLDFSNDTATASPRGPLTLARGIGASAGNKNFGWYVAGENYPTYYTLIDRIDYSNDTVTASRRGQINFAKGVPVTGNADYGWAGGGGSPGEISPTSTVERNDYSNDTVTASIRGPFAQTMSGEGATGSASFGYFPKGTTLHRIDFSNDLATSSARGNFTVTHSSPAGTGSQINGLAQPIRQINDFGAPYPVQRQAQRYAYFSFNASFNTSIWRIDYSNDLHDYTVGAFLSIGAYSGATVSSETKGYFVQGAASGFSYSGMQRIDYSNETVSPTGGVLSAATYGTSGVGNKDYGYIAGLGQPPQSSRVERIDFSNDGANAVIKGPLARVNSNTMSVGNQDYGYVCGGVSTGPIQLSTVDRIDYSNDTATAAPKGNLSQTRFSAGATGNANYGWVAGGKILGPTYYSTVDRIDYSNDTATAAPKGPLSDTRSSMGAAGNKNYGYWSGGGVPPRLYSERVDFANDTATALVRGGAIPSIATSEEQRGTSATINGNPQL